MSSSPDWIKFFSAAGIPSRYAAKYAVIFDEHRIQEDMLKDLNKEILYDMGIKTMGDVIAIMRHAKDVDEEKSRNRVLSGRKMAASDVPVKRLVKRVVQEEKVDSPATLSNTLSRRLGATAAPVRRVEAVVDREPVVKRVVIGNSAADRVIRLPSAGNGSVFQRLGGTADAGSGTLTSGSALRGLSLTAATQPHALKATATVRPTRTSPYSVKDRLGAGAKGDPVRKVIASNLKFKTDPPAAAAAASTSRPQVVSLKRSIFDRLGS